MLGVGGIGATTAHHRRRSKKTSTGSITASVIPTSSELAPGESLNDTVNWPTFIDPGNYSTSEAAQMISEVTINYIGDTGTATEPFGDGDINNFSVTVTDTAGNVRTFTVIPRTVVHVAPVAAGTLADQSFTGGSGAQIYDASGGFSGTDLSFSINFGTGVSIDSAIGIITFETDILPTQFGSAVTVTATNSGGSVQNSFNLHILEPVAYAADIIGLTDNPTYGDTAQINTSLTGTLNNLLGTETIIHHWRDDEGVIAGANTSTYTPVSRQNLNTLRYAPTIDGDEVLGAGHTVRYAPPVAGSLVPVNETQGGDAVQVNLAAGFTGSNLTYSGNVAWASIVGSTLTIADEVRTGTVRITATNSGGAAFVDLSVTIAAPVVAVTSAIGNRTIAQDGGDFTTDLRTVFTNATSYSVSGLSASIDGDGYTLRLDDGTLRSGVTITVTGSNAYNSADDVFLLSVEVFTGISVEDSDDPAVNVPSGSTGPYTHTIDGVDYTVRKPDNATLTVAMIEAAATYITEPAITGAPADGATMTLTPAIALYAGDDPGDATFQVYLDDVLQSGETDVTYVIQAADEDAVLKWVQTYDGVTIDSNEVTLTFADVTAPVLSSPTGAANGETGATSLGVTTDEGNGTLYWGIYPTASTPSAADVVAGTGATVNNSQAVSGAGVQSVSDQTGLTAGTPYKAHYVHDDAVANRSAVSTSAEFTTDAASFDPATLYAGTEDGLWFDMDDLSTLWQNTARSSLVDASGQSVQAIDDKSGNGYSMEFFSTAGVYTESGGAAFINMPPGIAGYQVASQAITQGKVWDWFIGIRTSETTGMLVTTKNVGAFAGAWATGTASPHATLGVSNYYINSGSAITPQQRGVMQTNIATGTALVAIAEDVAYSSATLSVRQPAFGYYLGGADFGIDGDVYCVIAVESSTVDATKRANIISYIQGKF